MGKFPIIEVSLWGSLWRPMPSRLRCSRTTASAKFEPSRPPSSAGSAKRHRPARSARLTISSSRSSHSRLGMPPLSKSVRRELAAVVEEARVVVLRFERSDLLLDEAVDLLDQGRRSPAAARRSSLLRCWFGLVEICRGWRPRASRAPCRGPPPAPAGRARRARPRGSRGPARARRGTRPRRAQQRGRAACSAACSSSLPTIPSARSTTRSWKAGRPLSCGSTSSPSASAGGMHELQRGGTVVQGGRAGALRPAGGLGGGVAQGRPPSSSSRSHSTSQARRPMTACSTERLAPERWEKACITQITPHRRVPASSHQASAAGSTPTPLWRSYASSSSPRVANPAAGRSRRVKRHAGTHSQPRSSTGSPAWASSQSSTPVSPVLRPSGCPCGSRRARPCAAAVQDDSPRAP